MAAASAVGPCGPPFEESGLSIEEIPGRGRGIITKRPYQEGETLFIEPPLMSCQFSWNREYKYLACEFCLRSLETAEQMACRLSSQPSIDLPLSADYCDSKPDSYVTCADCGTLYCSSECQRMAGERYHRGVCVGRMSPQRKELFSEMNETWRNMHFPPETTSIEVLARCFSVPPDSPYGQLLFQQLELLVHSTVSEDESLQHKLLQPQYAPQIDRIHQCLQLLYGEGERNCKWLTSDNFRSLLALLGRNQQGIGSSAFSRYVHNVEKAGLQEAAKADVDAVIDAVYEVMQEVSGPFLDVEGVGIYQYQSRLNHSCVANLEVAFAAGTHVLSIVATQDINPGEEVCISYLDECMRERSRHTRQKHLRENYLFVCSCPLCIAQEDQEDVTSDEEEDDGDEEDEEVDES